MPARKALTPAGMVLSRGVAMLPQLDLAPSRVRPSPG